MAPDGTNNVVCLATTMFYVKEHDMDFRVSAQEEKPFLTAEF